MIKYKSYHINRERFFYWHERMSQRCEKNKRKRKRKKVSYLRRADNLYLLWFKSLRFTVNLQFIDLGFWDFLTQVLSQYEYLITNHENIKNYCLVDIVTRLRIRKMHPELVKLEHNNLKLSKMRLLKAKQIITLQWTVIK